MNNRLGIALTIAFLLSLTVAAAVAAESDSHGSSRSPLISLLESGHEGVRMTQEEMDKISCWIDLALPHSGQWTEGMTPEDKNSYMRVHSKRLDWEKQEAANIQEYIDDQTASNRSGE
jgi:hypothetical protein